MNSDAERIIRMLEDNGFYNVRHVNGIVEAFFRPQRKGRDVARDRIDRVLDRMMFIPAVKATHTYPPRHDGVIRVTVMVQRDDERLIVSMPEEMRGIIRAFM